MCLEDSHLLTAEDNQFTSNPSAVDELYEFSVEPDHSMVNVRRIVAHKFLLLDSKEKKTFSDYESLEDDDSSSESRPAHSPCGIEIYKNRVDIVWMVVIWFHVLLLIL